MNKKEIEKAREEVFELILKVEATHRKLEAAMRALTRENDKVVEKKRIDWAKKMGTFPGKSK